MTYEEFEEKIEDAGFPVELSVRWSNGGTAGNCWDDTMYPISPDDPKELKGLDEILQLFAPDMSFLQYKILSKGLVTTSNYSEGDYYGGSEHYTELSVNLKELYEYMNEQGWLE